MTRVLFLLLSISLQARAGAHFAKYGPSLMHTHALWRTAFTSLDASDWSGRRRAWATFTSAARDTLALHRARPALLVAGPLVQIPCFVLFVSATRALIDADGVPREEEEALPPARDAAAGAAAAPKPRAGGGGGELSRYGLSRGGALWFGDLTERDRSLALPLSAAALTFANLELGFGGAPAGTLFARARGFLQLALIVGLPAIAHQPAGVFAYWIPAASFGTANLLLFRHSALVRRVVGLPPPRAFVRPGGSP